MPQSAGPSSLGKALPLNGDDAVPRGTATTAKPRIRGAFFRIRRFHPTGCAPSGSTLTTFRAKSAARNHGHMLLHLRGAGGADHAWHASLRGERSGEEMSPATAQGPAPVPALVLLCTLRSCAFSSAQALPAQAAFTRSNAIVTSASSTGSTFA